MKRLLIVIALLAMAAVPAQAETYTTTIEFDGPTHDVVGNPLEPRDIKGYRVYASDQPFSSLDDFDGDEIDRDQVWDEDTGALIDDATKITLVREYPDAVGDRVLYAAVATQAWGGKLSVISPVIQTHWRVLAADLPAPNAPSNLRWLDPLCEATSRRFVCDLMTAGSSAK